MSAVLDEAIHAPTRIAICSRLLAVDALEFGALRDELAVADSVLSKHLKILATAGHVHTDRRPSPLGRSRQWIGLTPEGREAVRAYLGELSALLASSATDSAEQHPPSSHNDQSLCCAYEVRPLSVDRTVAGGNARNRTVVVLFGTQ